MKKTIHDTKIITFPRFPIPFRKNRIFLCREARYRCDFYDTIRTFRGFRIDGSPLSLP